MYQLNPTELAAVLEILNAAAVKFIKPITQSAPLDLRNILPVHVIGVHPDFILELTRFNQAGTSATFEARLTGARFDMSPILFELTTFEEMGESKRITNYAARRFRYHERPDCWSASIDWEKYGAALHHYDDIQVKFLVK